MGIFSFIRKPTKTPDVSTSSTTASANTAAGASSAAAATAAGSADSARVKVLGTGCAKCHQMEANVKDALAELLSSEAVGFISDYAVISAMGVMSLPALAVDNKVVSSGKVLTKAQAMDVLKQALKL